MTEEKVRGHLQNRRISFLKKIKRMFSSKMRIEVEINKRPEITSRFHQILLHLLRIQEAITKERRLLQILKNKEIQYIKEKIKE